MKRKTKILLAAAAAVLCVGILVTSLLVFRGAGGAPQSGGYAELIDQPADISDLADELDGDYD